MTFDPEIPQVPNNTGAQPTFRIADLTNPNLKPWVGECMKKNNDEVIAGKIAFTARPRCAMAGGCPAFRWIWRRHALLLRSDTDTGQNDIFG